MLSGLVGLGLSVLLVAPHAAAPSPAPPVVVTGDNRDGQVNTVVTVSGTAGGSSGAGAQPVSGGSASTVTCTWTESDPYTTAYLNWLGYGDPGGRMYDVRCSDGSVTLSVYVPPAAPNVPPAVVLAGQLARQAVNQLPLPLPAVSHNPTGDAIVNVATWWWVSPGQWHALQQRTAVGPVWAQVTAEPVRSVWGAGDGTAPLVCTGPGRPYDASRPAASQSTSCSSTYTRSSADQPQTGPSVNDRFFTVTVTVFWAVRWTGSGGTGGQLPEISRTSTFGLRVAERQTVVTGGSG